ncbi:MAG: HAMP domain-containing histidine kinase [Ruminococcus sp.]|nr:HAMP domain-containing histidine kinase [Ruminococcus sp.]MCM1479712.1 HAMP domain-containing histidine kinase [Muribaculaceae bacterium]
MYPIIIFVLLAAVVLLLIKIFAMKKSAREIAEKLSEKLSEDTNTLIDISSGDGDMRALAEELNIQLKKLREERLRFQQGDAEIKEAVTNISHDLRTPLTAVFGYLDLLEREEKSETAENYLGQIRGRSEAMKQLTEELFRYSIAADGNRLSYEKICLNSVLEESLAEFYGAIVQRGIVPEIEISETRAERFLDKSALKRIFGNIIGNAVKYSGGDFAVRLSEDGTVTFSNTAEGLDKVAVGKLFDRFYTVETAGNSTGLGLSIAKLLAEQMGGSIRADYVGSKVVITVKFP